MHYKKNLNKTPSRQLNGQNNKRLFSTERLNNNYTAAWTDKGKIYKNTNVTAPSESQVQEAKDWVDNGSKL